MNNMKKITFNLHNIIETRNLSNSLMEYYSAQIQLSKDVIEDIFQQFKTETKMLVFGLGHDSRMWYEGNHKNTFFIEHALSYIDLNKAFIPTDRLVHYKYDGISVGTSRSMTDAQLDAFSIPPEILREGPFDIVLIDGPTGYQPNLPGRLLPCHWAARRLSKKGTIVYVDDSSRPLERYCIEKYFKKEQIQHVFTDRLQCTKILL